MKATDYTTLSLLFLLCACDEGDSEASRLERPRVLGVRFEANDEPQRASPQPGEKVDVRWLVRGPEGAVQVDYVLSACPSAGRSAGLPACAGDVLASAHERGEEPRLSLTVPDAYPLPADGGTPILVAGAVCEQGEASFDLSTLLGRCSGSAEVPETFSAYIDVGEGNLNPDLDGASLTFGGEAWSASEAAECPELSSPAKDAVDMVFTLPGSARETQDGAREPLRVTQFTTRGAFSRLFSRVDPADTSTRIELEWTPPKKAKADGEEVRVVAVVRDERGGTSWFERCALWRPEMKGEE